MIIRYWRMRSRGGIMSGHFVSFLAGKGENEWAYKCAKLVFFSIYLYMIPETIRTHKNS